MISKEEIEQTARKLAISTSDIQRDFLFGWLLNYLFLRSELRDVLFLKGGNALRKAYFVKTRFSKDLDFGIPGDIDLEVLREEVSKACAYISEHSGIEFVMDRNTAAEKFSRWKEDRWKVFEVRIYFKDFYGNSDHITLRISLDITRFDKHYLPLQNRPLIHPYSDATEVVCSLRCMQLEEILGTKLKCLLQREHAADLFDFIFSIYLNPDIPVDKHVVRQVFLKRTIFENNPGMAKQLLLKLPFQYLKAVWAKVIVCAQDVLLDSEETINRFASEIADMFKGIPEGSWNDRYYFGPEMRNSIMTAGRGMTLLRVSYSGAMRVVEPYALKFQERKDGVAKEYLYVYDRVGSKNNPGWKTFVAENMESLENTNEAFNPQFEIELRKASEYPQDRYLYDKTKKDAEDIAKLYAPTRRLRTPRQRTYGSYFAGPKYVFKCSTCGKTFYRKEYDSTLKQHKNKRGYPCYGYGIYSRTKY